MTPHPFSMADRQVLVTGSSRGIGRAMALAFAAAGARVIAHGSGWSPDLRSIADALGDTGWAIAADLSVRDDVTRLITEVLDRHGGIDVLVLNASIEVREDWRDIDTATFDKQVAVDLEAPLRLLQGFVPGMAERGSGRVLAIGSIQEIREHPRMLVYAALKAAQTSMIRNLARQLGGSGVTFNTLAPGAIATDRNASVLADPAYRRDVEARIPARRIGTPEDCVGAALLICSPAGGYINGERLLVDGGMHL